MIISWFSAGISSAYAAKLAIDHGLNPRLIYIHIEEHHPDNERFIRECSEWLGKEIEWLQSPYKSVKTVIRARRYINGPGGAPCTSILKRQVRKEFENAHLGEIEGYIWGFDYSAREQERARKIQAMEPDYKHYFPLIDAQLTKENIHCEFGKSGIKRPVMYKEGFPNNNCRGCVKGGGRDTGISSEKSTLMILKP